MRNLDIFAPKLLKYRAADAPQGPELVDAASPMDETIISCLHEGSVDH